MITVVANLKGGTGKSTVAFNLAVWLASRSVPVKVFDLDPQSTLHDVIDIRIEEGYLPELNVSRNCKKLTNDTDTEIIVDVGTSDMDSFNYALRHADRIITPVPPSQADIWSTQRFIKIISEAIDGDFPTLLGFINRADTHHAVQESNEAEEALCSISHLQGLGVRWCQRTIYRRAFSEGLAVFELQASSKAAKEVNDLAVCLYPVLTSQTRETELCL